ncbi:MAG TPA: GNAT family N-acetyltransferase [Actinomycetota bacterium]
MKPGIRPVTADDAEAVARLSTQLGYPATAEEIVERLAGLPSHHAVLVAELGGAVVGWIQVQESRLVVERLRADITGLVVDQTARREGVGRRLVEAVERWAADRGAERIRVRSNVVREDAHAFYPSLGFEIAKTSTVFEKRLS